MTLSDILADYVGQQQGLPATRAAQDQATGLANQQAIDALQKTQKDAADALTATRAAEDQALAAKIATLQAAISTLAAIPVATTQPAAMIDPAPAITGPASA
jgi:hypothetical protein